LAPGEPECLRPPRKNTDSRCSSKRARATARRCTDAQCSCADAPVQAANARSAFFGDLRQAYVVRRVNENISLQRQDELHSDQGQVGYRAWHRVDGRPGITAAGVVVIHSATNTARAFSRLAQPTPMVTSPRPRKQTAAARVDELSKTLAADGCLDAVVRVPDAVGDIRIRADLRRLRPLSRLRFIAAGDREVGSAPDPAADPEPVIGA
jgi:Phage capsid family